MQYYVCINYVLLLGFSPEISSIFIEIQLSPKGIRIVLNCKFYIDTAHNQGLETRCIYRLLHYTDMLMRSARPTGKCLSSGMLNKVIDGGTVLHLGNICSARSCKVTEGNAEGNDSNCQCAGNLVSWSNYSMSQETEDVLIRGIYCSITENQRWKQFNLWNVNCLPGKGHI